MPRDAEPLMIGIFGDWIFGAPDASHWHLDLLEGTFQKCAKNSEDFNAKKREAEFLDLWFGANWAEVALTEGLVPGAEECLGWKIHPAIGGEFASSNIGVFQLSMYQKVCASIHRNANKSTKPRTLFQRIWTRS